MSAFLGTPYGTGDCPVAFTLPGIHSYVVYIDWTETLTVTLDDALFDHDQKTAYAIIGWCHYHRVAVVFP